MNSYYQREPSYGNYWQQQPMKTFAGQPNWATQREVSHLEMRVDHLENEMNSEYNGNKDACSRCPESSQECMKLSKKDDRDHCVQMLKQCQEKC